MQERSFGEINVARQTDYENVVQGMYDQISDEVSDECLTSDPKCRVNYENNVKDNMEKVAIVIYADEKIHEDVTGVITVAGNIDNETVNDFGF